MDHCCCCCCRRRSLCADLFVGLRFDSWEVIDCILVGYDLPFLLRDDAVFDDPLTKETHHGHMACLAANLPPGLHIREEKSDGRADVFIYAEVKIETSFVGSPVQMVGYNIDDLFLSGKLLERDMKRGAWPEALWDEGCFGVWHFLKGQ